MKQSNNSQLRYRSSPLKILRRIALIAILIWGALAVNAWRYFSESGAIGVYFAARHALNVLFLPDEPKPGDLGGMRPLSPRETADLIQDRSVLYDDPRGPHWSVVMSHSENTVNKMFFGGPGQQVVVGDYLMDGPKICYLGSWLRKSSSYCMVIYKNDAGELFTCSSDGNLIRIKVR